MKLERCENGHFYDAERYSSCPFCDQKDPITGTVIIEDQPVTPQTDPIASLTEPRETETTVGYFPEAIGAEPVVGWLVCVAGNHVGEDFKLKAGRNFIGRNSSMDVALTGDASVSRDRHAILLYEPRNNQFVVQPGDARELSYLNDNVILNAAEINAYDRLTLGKTTLVFIPLCTERFRWEDWVKKEEK